MSRTTRALPVAVIAVALAACAPDAGSGPASTTTGASATTTSTAPARPPIPRPLDAGRFGANGQICELFTEEQARGLQLPDEGIPNPNSASNTHTCSRQQDLPPDHAKVEYTLWLAYDIFADTYSLASQYYQFTPREISGQPAVQRRTNKLEPPKACDVVIGLAENQGVVITVIHYTRNACDLAVAVAEQMVRNLSVR